MKSSASLASLGILLIPILIIALITVVIRIICYWKIVSKAGYSGALSLLCLVPFANIIMLVVFSFVEWPVQKELKQLKSQSGRIPSQPMQ